MGLRTKFYRTKFYTIPFLGKKESVALTLGHYMSNGNIAVQAVTKDGEPWATFSINIEGGMSKEMGTDHIFLDTNTYPEEVFKPFIEAGIISSPKDVRVVQSGFCFYPIVKVDKDKFVEVIDKK